MRILAVTEIVIGATSTTDTCAAAKFDKKREVAAGRLKSRIL